MKRGALPPLVALTVLVATVPALGYLKLGTRVGSTTANLEWTSLPVRYYVTDRGVDRGHRAAVSELRCRVLRGMGRGRDRGTLVRRSPASPRRIPRLGDSMTVLGYQNRPDLDRVLGATNFIIDTTTGEIVESDIFFNSCFPWSTDAAGVTGRHDVQSIAVHEIGHLLGLGALGAGRDRDDCRRPACPWRRSR